MGKIQIKDLEISIVNQGGEEYISLTDMVKNENEGDHLIKKWLSTKNTIEYLGVWERLKNPNFNLAEFGHIRNESGTNKFTMSAKKWHELTGGIGIKARSGRYGSGTFAHKDIALKFAAWISPEFELLIMLEFQRLKEAESKNYNQVWDFRRFLSKANYRIQTDAVKDILIPEKNIPKDKEWLIYADEADLLNKVVFNVTAKDWKEQNPNLALGGSNVRDHANTHQLIVIANLEPLNAELIRNKVPQKDRFKMLRQAAIEQLKSLSKSNLPQDAFIDSPIKTDIKKFDK